MVKYTLLSVIIFYVSLTSQPTTIFIHGTTFTPLHTLLSQLFFCPYGLQKAVHKKRNYCRLPRILFESSADEFPLESFYTFGWSGKLCFKARKQAAQNLYYALKKLSYGPLTIIGHSHGCNVALSLAQIAQEHNDKELSIDRLILLASPVQTATAPYIDSSLFKKIYSFHSVHDVIQVLDPQGFYRYTKNIGKEKQPLFSGRLFKSTPTLKQARVLIDYHNPFHSTFLLKPFVKALPRILKLLDTYDRAEPVMINIPAQGSPFITTCASRKRPKTKKTMQQTADIQL